jgi:hypothetical protein
MYCSIEEAWPELEINKRNSIKREDAKQSEQVVKYNVLEEPLRINADDYDDFKLFMNLKNNSGTRESLQQIINNKNKNSNVHTKLAPTSSNLLETFDDNKNNKCNIVIEHIQNCDECLKNLYRKYNLLIKPSTVLSDLSKTFNNMITPENKDIVSVVLFGLLVILTLHLIRSDV